MLEAYNSKNAMHPHSIQFSPRAKGSDDDDDDAIDTLVVGMRKKGAQES